MASVIERPTRRDFMSTAIGGIVTLGPVGRLFAGEKPSVSFGVAADCQYKDAKSAGRRYYRNSISKLQACVDDFNAQELDFVIHLGDFIDAGFSNFDDVLPVYDKLAAPHYHALGNHDFAVAPSQKAAVPAKLGMPGRYYDFAVKGWRFIVLDGNDVSLIGRNKGDDEYERAKAMQRELKRRGAPNAVTWNGAVGAEQMAWLQDRLSKASAEGEKVVCFSHYPVFPKNVHNLWNDDQIVALLESHRCVVAYMNGHNHAGHYGVKNGIHYVTMPGMVDTPDQNAYATVMGLRTALILTGKGRAPSRELRIRGA